MKRLFFLLSFCLTNLAQAGFEPSFLEELESQNLRSHFLTETLEPYGRDFGNMVTTRPAGVFRPTQVEQLQKFLRLAYGHGIKMSCRGRGRSAFGQSQVEDGVIIDLSQMFAGVEPTLESGPDSRRSLRVPTHWTWLHVIEKTLKMGLTVPITIDNLDLSVGGTLSFGALGGPSYKRGSGADHVRSLRIATLDGQERWYEKEDERDTELFNGVLCGLGQFGIMLEAKIAAEPAPEKVVMYQLGYDDPARFFRDQKTLFNQGGPEHLKGFVTQVKEGWRYVIEVGSYVSGHETPSVQETLAAFTPQSREEETLPYGDFVNRVTKFTEALEGAGALANPMPWYNILVPEKSIQEHLALALETEHLTGSEPIIVYPMDSAHFKMPFFMRPEGTFYLLGVLHNTSFAGKKDYPHEAVRIRNKMLYEAAKKQGGFRYPVDATPFTPEDWVRHFGDKWNTFLALKNKYDGKRLLGTGLGIFE